LPAKEKGVAADSGKVAGAKRSPALLLAAALVLVGGVAAVAFAAAPARPSGDVAATIAVAAQQRSAAQRISQLGEMPAGKPEHVQVVYFYANHRCWSCRSLERLTRKTVSTYFTDAINSGYLELVVLNYEEAKNKAIVDEYGAWGSSLYIGIEKGGRKYVWPMSDAYLLVDDEPQFIATLRARIDAAAGLQS
jgi:hypothetical protein